MRENIQVLKDFIDKTIIDETGEVGMQSDLIRSLRTKYFLDIDDEATNNIIRAKKEINRTLREGINSLKAVHYPREFDSAEYINVLRDAEREDYGSATIDLNDIYPFITEKEKKYLPLLSSSGMCNMTYAKQKQHGDQVDLDFSEAKLEVYYDKENPSYNQEEYDKVMVENHHIIYEEKSYQKEPLERLFNTFFNENSLFDKRRANEGIIDKCINNVVNAKDKEKALLESVTQYHLFRSDKNIYDVSFENENVVSNKPKLK